MFKRVSHNNNRANTKAQEEAKRMNEILKILEELVNDYGESQTYHDIKSNKEVRKIFITKYGRPLKFKYQRDPR
jgi:hypothetical protein